MPTRNCVNLNKRGELESQIVSALRVATDAHGPITVENAPSAAKRVIYAIKEYNKRCRKYEQERA